VGSQIEAVIPRGSLLAVMAPTPVRLLDDPSIPLMPEDFEMVQTLVLDSSIIVNTHGGLVPARAQDARAALRFRDALLAPTETEGEVYSSASSQPGTSTSSASARHTVSYVETPPQKRMKLDLMSPAHFSTPRRETYAVTSEVPAHILDGDSSDEEGEAEMETQFEAGLDSYDEPTDVQTPMRQSRGGSGLPRTPSAMPDRSVSRTPGDEKGLSVSFVRSDKKDEASAVGEQIYRQILGTSTSLTHPGESTLAQQQAADRYELLATSLGSEYLGRPSKDQSGPPS